MDDREAGPASAEAFDRLGAERQAEGRLDEAIAAFERAIALKPELASAHTNLALARLLTGDFAAGWPEYEWRLARPGVGDPRGAAPRWDGGDLGGRPILLQAEQGLGDSIQFIRYAPMVAARGGRVIVACQPPLVRLFKGADGVDAVIEAGRAAAKAACWAPLPSLPGLFGTALETIPAPGPYLTADPTLAELWRGRLASRRGRKVGVVWRGNPEHRNDRSRSIPAAQFASMLGAPGASIVSLQKDASTDELAALGVDVLNAGPRLADLADTAALIANLDLVLSVDTAVAHLAGALGARVWTLIAFAPDWRWLRDRGDSPWYPTMRLFRQPAAGDWTSVAEQVRAQLSAGSNG